MGRELRILEIQFGEMASPQMMSAVPSTAGTAAGPGKRVPDSSSRKEATIIAAPARIAGRAAAR